MGLLVVVAARTLPHTPRAVDVGDDAPAELDVLVGFDDDLAGEATRLSNRIRSLLTGIHPRRRTLVSIAPRTHLAWATSWSRRSWPRWTNRR